MKTVAWFWVLVYLMSVQMLVGQLDTLKQQVTQVPEQLHNFRNSGFFSVFTGGVNALYKTSHVSYNFDLAVQTYHYFLITGKNQRYTNDKQNLVKLGQLNPDKIYRGVDFYLLSRASLDFDTLKAIANDYLTSLQASPFTVRFKKEYFLSQLKELSEDDYSPVISMNLIGDIRAIPFNSKRKKIELGVSSHFYLSLSAFFKRLEIGSEGQVLDKGTLYFQPAIGLATGSPEMIESVLSYGKYPVIFSSECRFGFTSERNAIKDFAFLVRYSLSEIIGPQFRTGILLSAFK